VARDTQRAGKLQSPAAGAMAGGERGSGAHGTGAGSLSSIPGGPAGYDRRGRAEMAAEETAAAEKRAAEK